MESIPIWRMKTSPNHFETLNRELTVDVTVIGGGITGITTAQLLKEKGFNVVVLESRKVGEGTTGQSTGNLYGITEYSLKELKQKYDTSTLQQVVLARLGAIDLIKNNVGNFNIDCNFHPRPMFLFEKENSIDIDEEISIAKEIGLPVHHIDEQFPFSFDKGMVLPNQAQINPLTYTQHLAKEIHGENCQIFENSMVSEIEDKDDFVLITANGFKVKSKYAIHATHTPKGLQVQYHTTLGPYREYGVAAKLNGNHYPEGIFWGHFADRKYSVRSYGNPENPHLICVGSMHKVGQAGDNRKNIQEVKDFLSKHFDVNRFTHQWGGQNYKSADLLPYIGIKSSCSKEYVATGFSTDGLVYGTLSAQILSDTLSGIDNPYSEIFKANRHQPLKAAKKFVKENADVVAKLIGDFLSKGESQEARDLLPEEGKLLQSSDGKVAAYKNAQGEVQYLSPICPHMGCTVHWNHAEKTWDCPCHGSRFDTDGSAIEGPALDGLTMK